MKHIFKLFLLVGLVVGLTAEADAAKKRTRARTSNAAPAVTVGETKNYGDALTTCLYTIKKGDSKISVEYPVGGSPALVKLLRRYVVESVDDKNVNTYANMETPDQLLKAAIRQYGAKAVAGGSRPTIDQTVSVSYSNNNVVTVKNEGYTYTGGAHEMPWSASATFLIADGSRLSQKMLPSFAAIKPYVLKGFAQYAECSVNDLEGYGYGVDDLDYPAYDSPYIDEKGLNLIYGPYEIGPYSIGMPTAAIPLDVMKRLCSGTASKFFE